MNHNDWRTALWKFYSRQSHGFCAGVDRAIEIVNVCLWSMVEPPIYAMRHEVVHNKFVVKTFANRGAVFVEELDEVPDGAIVIFQRMRLKAVEDEAERRDLTVFDATCPLVAKSIEVNKFAKTGVDAVLIGHAGHPEVEGTMGRFDPQYGGRIHLIEDVVDVANLDLPTDTDLAFVTPNHLSMDDTAEVIDALKINSPKSMRLVKMIFVMPPKTVKMRSRNLRHVVKWC